MEFAVLSILVPFGKAKKIVKYSKENGAGGATIVIGSGTVKNNFLDFFGVNEIKKEIVLILGFESFLDELMKQLDSKFNILKKGFGIGFLFSVSHISNKKNLGKVLNLNSFESKEKKIMKSAIFTIVNRGKANEVVDVSLAAGAKGGTIMHGRGSGENQTTKLFNMEIEPEKEIVLTIVDDENIDNVVDTIRKKTDVEQDGHGILFVVPVLKSYGVK